MDLTILAPISGALEIIVAAFFAVDISKKSPGTEICKENCTAS